MALKDQPLPSDAYLVSDLSSGAAHHGSDGHATGLSGSESEAAPVNSLRASLWDPGISMILPIKDRPFATLTCIQSLSTTLPNVPFELLLVDMNASREVREAVGTVGGDVRLVEDEVGDLSPYDLGAHRARKGLLLLLHDDTILLPGFLQPLISAMGLDPALAAVQPEMISLLDKDDVLPAGAVDASAPSASVLTGMGDFVAPSGAAAICTACVLVRTEAFLSVGGVGPAGGDVGAGDSLEKRLLSAGWRVRRLGESKVVHRGSCEADSETWSSATLPPEMAPDRQHHAAAAAPRKVSGHSSVLVVARVGDSSVHRSWCAPRGERSFDVALEYFGDEPNKYQGEADFYSHRPSARYPETLKYSGISAWLDEQPGLAEGYDYVFLPDDDLVCDAPTLERFFDVASAFRLSLAQPALSSHSYFSHAVTLQVPGALLRFTNFVEVMAPLFSRDAFELCRPTFTLSRSSWGLDVLWPSLLGNPSRGIAIVDATPIYHSRPTGTGALYRSLTEDPRAEMSALQRRFNIPDPYLTRVLETVPALQSRGPVAVTQSSNWDRQPAPLG